MSVAVKYIFTFLFFSQALVAQKSELKKICGDFAKGYGALNIPPTELSYKNNFENIQPDEELIKQEKFLKSVSERLMKVNEKYLEFSDLIRSRQLKYEIAHNLERIALEKKWNSGKKQIPNDGLHQLENYKDWYSYYVKHFTSVSINPEEVFEYGKKEVSRVHKEIDSLRVSLGFLNDADFYKALAADSFFIGNKQVILNRYAEIDGTVRKNIARLFLNRNIDKIEVMEWPEAGRETPPGIYLRKENTAYGTDVFQFNFFGSRHNKRCMNWLYMHEAIPGHHLQSLAARQRDSSGVSRLFFYFGNAEGWACYIENLGGEVGLYKDSYSYLGKCEWDLVRSARLVMEVGIHYYGWSFEKAMQYWKENIKGQDEIAEREIRRITRWAGQALCYKVGAKVISEIVAKKLKAGEDIRNTHEIFLQYSDVPLQVLNEIS